jgi:hypothetical protein
MDEEQALRAVDQLANAFGDDPNLRSIYFSYDNPGKIVVIVAEAAKLDGMSMLLDLPFELEVREGPAIVAQIGKLEEKEADELTAINLAGGQKVTTSRASDYYGTITLLGKITIEATGNQTYKLSEERAVVSNNHVIAQNDTGVPGDELSQSGTVFGSYQAAVPLTDHKIHCDVAIGEVTLHPADRNVGVREYEVEGYGRISGVRRPTAGEGIRKRGASSGSTSGSIVGRATVYSKGRSYRGTYKTSGSFTESGDSGALILGSDMRAIGVHAWGDEDGGASYFAGFKGEDTVLDEQTGVVFRF